MNIFQWAIWGCAAFAAAGSKGPCVFLDMKDCLDRADEIQKERSLKLPPFCIEQEAQVLMISGKFGVPPILSKGK